MPQRFLDLGTQLSGMFGEPADLLEDLQALQPHFSLEQHFGEEAEERVGLGALLGFAKDLRRSQESADVARIALQLAHPERFELVEFFVVDQRIRVIGEAHEAAYSS